MRTIVDLQWIKYLHFKQSGIFCHLDDFNDMFKVLLHSIYISKALTCFHCKYWQSNDKQSIQIFSFCIPCKDLYSNYLRVSKWWQNSYHLYHQGCLLKWGLWIFKYVLHDRFSLLVTQPFFTYYHLKPWVFAVVILFTVWFMVWSLQIS